MEGEINPMAFCFGAIANINFLSMYAARLPV
jgi:hypothetical protein